jgi:hypothetical protein
MNSVLDCPSDERVREKCGNDWRKQREYGLRTGDHESQGWSRKDMSTLFRTINLFDFGRRAYRNSTWKSLQFSIIFTCFHKYAKSIFKLVMSVCKSVRTEHFCSKWTDFIILVFLENISRNLKFN